jgi:AAA domain
MSDVEKDLGSGKARVHPETGSIYATTSWASVDLEPYKRGEQVIEPPSFLARTDGRCIIYPGRPHVFYGESESYKTFAALMAARSFVEQGLNVVYVDLEGSEASFVDRARLVQIADGYIGNALKYIRPIDPLTGDAQADFYLHELDLAQPSLIVLDGVTELYALQGWDINKATDAAQFQRMFGFRGMCASIAIDHTAKDAGRGVLGSQHKRAGLDGSEYEFRPVQRGGRGRPGIARVLVTKDRHGFIREWALGNPGVVGSLHIGEEVNPGYIEPPTMMEQIDPQSDAQDTVRDFLREHPGSSANAVIKGTHLRRDTVLDALSGLQVLGEAVNHGTPQRGAWELCEL